MRRKLVIERPHYYLSSGVSVALSTVSNESPHIVTSGNITLYDSFQRNLFKFWSMLSPEAMASVASLASIWGTAGTAPTGAQLAINNLYNGGGGTNNGDGTCTIGGVTFPCNESTVDYIGQSLNPNFVNSNGAAVDVFGRLRNAFGIACVIGQLVPSSDVDSDGLPKVGTFTIVFPTSTSAVIYQPTSSGGCGMQTNMAGQSVSLAVTAVTGNANYTKHLTPTLSSGNATSLWVKLDVANGVFNFMSVEDQRPSGRYEVDRSILNVTGANGTHTTVEKMEYISLGSNVNDVVGGVQTNCYQGGQWNCGYEFYRLFIDEGNDVGYLVSNNGLPGDNSGGTGAPANYLQFTAAAKPIEMGACSSGGSCSTTVALSIGMAGQYSGAGQPFTPTGDYDGCVSPSSRAVKTDSTLSCDVTGTGISSVTAVENERELYAADVVATLLTNTTASTTLSFTGASDIYTAVPSN